MAAGTSAFAEPVKIGPHHQTQAVHRVHEAHYARLTMQPALQIRQSMETEGLSKTAMARRMKTSRPAPERLLDPGNTAVTRHTRQRAAQAIGKRLHLELIGPG